MKNLIKRIFDHKIKPKLYKRTDSQGVISEHKGCGFFDCSGKPVEGIKLFGVNGECHFSTVEDETPIVFREIKMKEYLGKKVRVKLKPSGKMRLSCDDEILTGEILPKVDWLVGCPVFTCELGDFGVGYECDIIEVIGGKPQ